MAAADRYAHRGLKIHQSTRCRGCLDAVCDIEPGIALRILAYLTPIDVIRVGMASKTNAHNFHLAQLIPRLRHIRHSDLLCLERALGSVPLPAEFSQLQGLDASVWRESVTDLPSPGVRAAAHRQEADTSPDPDRHSLNGGAVWLEPPALRRVGSHLSFATRAWLSSTPDPATTSIASCAPVYDAAVFAVTASTASGGSNAARYPRGRAAAVAQHVRANCPARSVISTASWLQQLSNDSASCAKLIKLKVDQATPAHAVCRILRCATRLQKLSASAADRLTDEALRGLGAASRCGGGLREVDLSHCFRLTDAGVAAVLAAAPRLQRLLLHGCPRVTDATLRALYDDDPPPLAPATVPAAAGSAVGACLHTLSLSPGLGGVTAAGLRIALRRGAFSAGALQNLLLDRARFEEAEGGEGGGWADVLFALWLQGREGGGQRITGPSASASPLLVHLASPQRLADADVSRLEERCRAAPSGSEESAPPVCAAVAAAELVRQQSWQLRRPVVLHLSGQRDLSQAAERTLTQRMMAAAT